MKTFTDADGRAWDITVGRQSYGLALALFLPRDGGEVLQAALPVDNWVEAERYLAGLDEAGLVALLRDAEPHGL
ncbi:hypothetical protein DFR31_2439 [Alkalispirillum mobile]|uniref:Uncharacterized protein n=1 Tax=Alkalispirillum mobile TaxID=85925 RepID=A0A498C1R7_9GAMM|nr:hypothetical protein [Alkalispirillum mobile]RLK47120.1 hypothetical protein DFR31_2439 [Alkalispirillum mobile]